MYTGEKLCSETIYWGSGNEFGIILLWNSATAFIAIFIGKFILKSVVLSLLFYYSQWKNIAIKILFAPVQNLVTKVTRLDLFGMIYSS